MGNSKSTRLNKTNNNNGNWSAHSSGRNSNSDSTSERPSRQNHNSKPVKGCYIRVATLVEAKELKTVGSFAATLNSFNTTKIVHNFGGRNDRVSSHNNFNKIKIVDNCQFAGYAASPDADSLPQPPMA